MATESKDRPQGTGRARFVATATLLTFACGLGYAGLEGYRAATDSFVAPAILSPESDLVLQTKARVAELEVERARILAEADTIDADLTASERAIARLRELEQTIDRALGWTKDSNARQAFNASTELRTLNEQHRMLVAMAERQATISASADVDLSANIISRTDRARESVALDQVNLALLENERARLASQATLNQAHVAQTTLDAKGHSMMPEQIAREEQLVHVELEIARLESEQRAKRTEKKVVLAKLAKMDELSAQLRGRPLFRATESRLEVAFVPYTQMDGVAAGATVYDCIWGVLHCRSVGRITEVVLGEVILPDPWGSPARGQYAVLDLTEHASAQSKVLRVRAGRGAAPSPSSPEPSPVTISAR